MIAKVKEGMLKFSMCINRDLLEGKYIDQNKKYIYKNISVCTCLYTEVFDTAKMEILQYLWAKRENLWAKRAGPPQGLEFLRGP